MLIPYSYISNFCKIHNIHIKGIFHVGAHECEEMIDYNKEGIDNSNIIWIEGNPEICNKMISKGVPNMINALIDEESGKTVKFNITNNGQSSSILVMKSIIHMYLFQKHKF